VVLASVALALTLGGAACGPQVELEPMDESTTAEDTGPPPPITTTTTTVGTTVAPTTDDGPAMTTIEATSSDADSSDDSPCAFYGGCPSDFGTNPFGCDVFAQDCPVGEKCMPWGDDGGPWNATRCTPIADDPAAVGEPCTVEGGSTSGLDDCDIGVMCFHVDPDTNQGTCVAMCSGTVDDPQCAVPEQVCSITNDGVLTLCLDACHPLTPACEEGTGCHPLITGEAFICWPTAGADGVYGDACDYLTTCVPGLTCVAASAFPDCVGAGCCTEYCDTTLGLPCPDAALGVACQPWFEMGTAPPGYENVGGCALPP
jgi:hypothetical protein